MSTAPLAASPRISWDDVPRHVQAAVEHELGSPIRPAVTQHGGFSPGAAVRVVCEDGRRAFVKAVGLSLNPDSPGLHRAEIHAMSVLPDEVPAPRLLASYDDGDWVALALEDVDGRRPDVPWMRADVDAMSVALGHLARTKAPEQLPPFADIVNMLTSWDEVAANPAGIDRALLDRLDEMTAAQSLAREASRPVTPSCTGTPAPTTCSSATDVLCCSTGPGPAAARHGWTACCLPWTSASRAGPTPTTSCAPMPSRATSSRIISARSSPAWSASGPSAPAAHRRPGLPTIRTWQAHCRDHALRWVDDGALWN